MQIRFVAYFHSENPFNVLRPVSIRSQLDASESTDRKQTKPRKQFHFHLFSTRLPSFGVNVRTILIFQCFDAIGKYYLIYDFNDYCIFRSDDRLYANARFILIESSIIKTMRLTWIMKWRTFFHWFGIKLNATPSMTRKNLLKNSFIELLPNYRKWNGIKFDLFSNISIWNLCAMVWMAFFGLMLCACVMNR